MSTPLSSIDQARRQAAGQAARGARAAVIALVISAMLGAVKVMAGIAGHSYALIADGVESLLDIASSLAVWGSLKIAMTDPNKRFPYGYGKVEPLVGLAIATTLVGIAGVLAVKSIHEIRHPHLAPAPFTLLVLVAVVAVKELLYRWLVRTGREIDSRAIESDAWHHRSDAITSIAAFLGISVALIGGKGYEQADDWAALAACGLIAFNGVRLFSSGLGDILDAAPSGETLDKIRAVAASVDGVSGIDECRARKSGLGWLVDIHVEVDGAMPVSEGHRIAHEVKDALLAAKLGVLDALVHIEPTGGPFGFKASPP